MKGEMNEKGVNLTNQRKVYFAQRAFGFLNAGEKSKNRCGANELSVTVISNRKCHEECGFFDF
jgi:hypothetical protein